MADRLTALGYAPERGVGKTGVVALLEGKVPGPCVLLRADMDALPVHEMNDVPYRSTVEGVMHACGHDCHVAALLATARVLKRLGPLERGSLKLVFQPAEEGGNGALAMIEDGVLESPKVDTAFGLHVWNHLDVGKIAVTPGPFMGAVGGFKARIIGVGGHGAIPHEARDPVLAAAHVVTALQQIVARNVDPLEAAVVTVGSIHGGDAFNVIPEEVSLEGTLRCFDPALADALPGHIERVVTHTAEAFGCRAEIEVEMMMRATVNTPEMAALVRDVAEGIVGKANVVEMKTLGSEDFSEFLHRVPGCFFFVGSRNEAKGRVHTHHSASFDIDEDALPLAVEMLAAVALRRLAL